MVRGPPRGWRWPWRSRAVATWSVVPTGERGDTQVSPRNHTQAVSPWAVARRSARAAGHRTEEYVHRLAGSSASRFSLGFARRHRRDMGGASPGRIESSRTTTGLASAQKALTALRERRTRWRYSTARERRKCPTGTHSERSSVPRTSGIRATTRCRHTLSRPARGAQPRTEFISVPWIASLASSLRSLGSRATSRKRAGTPFGHPPAEHPPGQVRMAGRRVGRRDG
jgi:hypothetical protein